MKRLRSGSTRHRPKTRTGQWHRWYRLLVCPSVSKRFFNRQSRDMWQSRSKFSMSLIQSYYKKTTLRRTGRTDRAGRTDRIDRIEQRGDRTEKIDRVGRIKEAG